MPLPSPSFSLLPADLNDEQTNSLVIETLSEAHLTEPTRKCFRLVGGVLVERTVEDVLPSLKTQSEQVSCCFCLCYTSY